MSQNFIRNLDVDEVIAHLLVTEGFSSMEEISMVSTEELSSVEGFDESLSNELIKRANLHLEKIKAEHIEILKKEGTDDYFLNQDFLSTHQLLKLNDNGIKTRDDLADLSSDELKDIITDINIEKANQIILESRKHWFEDGKK